MRAHHTFGLTHRDMLTRMHTHTYHGLHLHEKFIQSETGTGVNVDDMVQSQIGEAIDLVGGGRVGVSRSQISCLKEERRNGGREEGRKEEWKKVERIFYV